MPLWPVAVDEVSSGSERDMASFDLHEFPGDHCVEFVGHALGMAVSQGLRYLCGLPLLDGPPGENLSLYLNAEDTVKLRGAHREWRYGSWAALLFCLLAGSIEPKIPTFSP